MFQHICDGFLILSWEFSSVFDIMSFLMSWFDSIALQNKNMYDPVFHTRDGFMKVVLPV